MALARAVPEVPATSGGRTLAQELDFGAELGQTIVAVRAGAGPEIVAEAEEQQGEDGWRERPEIRDGLTWLLQVRQLNHPA